MDITLMGHNVSTTVTAVAGELSPGFFVSGAEERALRIIGCWLDESARRSLAGQGVPAEITDRFYDWLHDPRDRRAKQRALDIVMEGCMDGESHDDLFLDGFSDGFPGNLHDDPMPDNGPSGNGPSGDRPAGNDTHTIFNINSY